MGDWGPGKDIYYTPGTRSEVGSEESGKKNGRPCKGGRNSVGGRGSTPIQAEPGKSRGKGASLLPTVKYLATRNPNNGHQALVSLNTCIRCLCSFLFHWSF